MIPLAGLVGVVPRSCNMLPQGMPEKPEGPRSTGETGFLRLPPRRKQDTAGRPPGGPPEDAPGSRRIIDIVIPIIHIALRSTNSVYLHSIATLGGY